MTITFNVHNQNMALCENEFIASETVNYINCKFCFSEEWSGFEKTAIFSNVSESYSVLLSDDACIVPHEVLSGSFNVSVFGTQNGEKFRRITTNSVAVRVEESGYKEGDTPDEPTPSVYETMVSQLADCKKQTKTVEDENEKLGEEIDGIKTDFSNLPKKFAAKTHTHKTDDITDLNIPTKTSQLENDSYLVADANYVHTDNNYTDAAKAKLESLHEYDDSEIKTAIDTKAAIPHTAVSGYPITLTDHLENKPLLSCRVYGNEGGIGELDAASGKYKIPLKITGKNLLTYPYAGSNKIVNGLTITDNGDGSITVSGTATVTTYFIVEDQAKFTLPEGKYILSGGSDSAYLYADLYNGQTRVFQKRDAGSSLSFDLSSQEYTGLRVFFVLPAETVFQNTVLKPQLETGTAATGWETYKSADAVAETDAPIAQNEYVDFIGKKHVSGNTESAISVTGELLTLKSAANNIICGTQTAPKKIETGYYQDINKIIAELKNAILSQGSNT